MGCKSCCCICHVEMEELRFRIENMWKCHKVCNHLQCGWIPSSNCFYYYNPLGVRCCPKHEFEEWHKRDCLPGEFSNCGVEKLHMKLNVEVRFCKIHVSLLKGSKSGLWR